MAEPLIESTAAPTAVHLGRPAFIGKKHLVASSHYLASQAGLRMFERGGNAIDAGVAAGIALNVLERHLTDVGGVAPTVIFRPGMAEPETIDGLGHWPASLDLATYRARHGDDRPVGIPRSVTPPRPTPRSQRSRVTAGCRWPRCSRPTSTCVSRGRRRNARSLMAIAGLETRLGIRSTYRGIDGPLLPMTLNLLEGYDPLRREAGPCQRRGDRSPPRS